MTVGIDSTTVRGRRACAQDRWAVETLVARLLSSSPPIANAILRASRMN